MLLRLKFDVSKFVVADHIVAYLKRKLINDNRIKGGP